MINIFVGLLALIIFSSVLQARFKIPSPITLITVVLAIKAVGLGDLNITDAMFDGLVVAAFPLLIAADAMKLKWSDLREYWVSLVWVAGVAVLFAVLAGVVINQYLFLNVPLSLAAIAALFCTITATDPVTVSAVLNNFKVPHKLKILVEGESLLNDATAIIVFSIALIAMNATSTITAEFIGTKVVAVICGAMIVGGILGLLSFTLLRLSEDPLVEASILMMTAYASYIVAEMFHFSGILAVIVAIVLCSEKVRQILEGTQSTSTVVDDYGFLRHSVMTSDNHKFILKIFDFTAMFAASALFVAIAAMVNFADLMMYWKEILAIFVASTIIRGITMLKFALVSNKSSLMKAKVSRHWWAVLTFAGSKGAISILMVHMIPDSFQYKHMFEVIVIGNIILSTFIYAGILAVVIPLNKLKFDKEVEAEAHEH
jgi:CPA1 family monovalent cation:H+ antiporter